MRKEIKAASASKKAICSQLFVINYQIENGFVKNAQTHLNAPKNFTE
jgi:hypothetical protein